MQVQFEGKEERKRGEESYTHDKGQKCPNFNRKYKQYLEQQKASHLGPTFTPSYREGTNRKVGRYYSYNRCMQ